MKYFLKPWFNWMRLRGVLDVEIKLTQKNIFNGSLLKPILTRPFDIWKYF